MKQKKWGFSCFILICLLSILVPLVTLAGGGEQGIPFGFLFSQIFNFSIFALILFFLLRKKGPAFLRQKKADFLEYRKSAKSLEQKHQADGLTLQKKIHHLTNKQKNIKTEVAVAISHKEKEMTQEMEHRLKNLKSRAEQELKRWHLQHITQLRVWFSSKVMVQIKRQIKEAEPAKKEKLNHYIIQKWEQL